MDVANLKFQVQWYHLAAFLGLYNNMILKWEPFELPCYKSCDKAH